MQEWVMRDGAQVPVPAVDRGPPLLRGRDEWVSRYRAYAYGPVVPLFAGLAGVLAVVTLVFPGALLPLSVLWTAFLAYVGGYLLLAHRTFGDLRDGGAPPGVYLNGLELPVFPLYFQRLFVPWEEVDRLEETPSPVSGTLLVVHMEGSRWSWRFPARILGPEGVRLATAKLIESQRREDAPGPDGRPKLVVYSARGAKTESEPGR